MTAPVLADPEAAGNRQDVIAAAAPGIFVFLWSSGFVVARYAMRDAGPLSFLAVRMAITTALLLLIAQLSHQPRISRPVAGWAALAAIGLHVLYLGGVWVAIDLGLPAGLGALIAGLHPVLTAVGGRFLLGERLRRLQWVGVGLGIAGVGFVVAQRLSEHTGQVTGKMLLCMAVGVIGMSAGTLTQRAKASAMPLVWGTVVHYAVATVILTIGMALFEGFQWHTTSTLVWSGVWSVFGLSMGSTLLLTWLISRQAAARVSSLFFLTPALSMVQARILFGERIGPLALIGMVISLTGVALTTRG